LIFVSQLSLDGPCFYASVFFFAILPDFRICEDLGTTLSGTTPGVATKSTRLHRWWLFAFVTPAPTRGSNDDG
jgi:hypothetical protein